MFILDNNHTLNRHIFINAKDYQLRSIAEVFFNVFRIPLSREKKEKIPGKYKTAEKLYTK